MIRVRVTEEEYSKIENDAWGKRMRISEHVRSVLLPGEVVPKPRPAMSYKDADDEPIIAVPVHE